MKEKINSIKKKNIWELTTLLERYNTIEVKWIFKTKRNEVKWIFKTKRNAKGEVEKYKAKLLANGCKQ
jgi:hypothetical protein